MPVAVLIFQFDPIAVRIGDLTVTWSVLALAGVVMASLVVSGLVARSVGLRADDVAFIAVGAVPGAVVGARLGYGLLHWDYYRSTPQALLDPAVGGLELGLGVVGGLLTAGWVAQLFGAPVGRWLHVATAPVLFLLGAGKLSMVLGGAGQGAPSSSTWATAYAGPGPWGSLAPALPSLPSQAYEGIVTLVFLGGLTLLMAAGVLGQRDGRSLLLGLAAWALLRAIISFTWRDEPLVLGLNAGGLIAVAIAILFALGYLWLAWLGPWIRSRGRARPVAEVAPVAEVPPVAEVRPVDPEVPPVAEERPVAELPPVAEVGRVDLEDGEAPRPG